MATDAGEEFGHSPSLATDAGEEFGHSPSLSLIEKIEDRRRRNSSGSPYIQLYPSQEISEVAAAKTTVFDKKHVLKALFLFVLSGSLAIIPVSCPFGNPFAKDGNNGIIENWAYYSTYNIIGWGAIWLKITLWNCAIWEADFFFPFMQNKNGFFALTWSLASWCAALTWSTCFFLAGYYVFHNPIPFGTITGGVPCYVVNFLCMYIFLVPRERKATCEDHVRIIRCWIPFVIWVSALCVYIYLTWVNRTFVLSWHKEKGKEVQYIVGSVVIQLTFIAIREALVNLPIGAFMGNENKDVAFLWNLGYSAMYSTYCDWLFPGMPHTPLGLIAMGSIIAANSIIAFLQFFTAKEALGILEVFLNNFCDVCSGLSFLFIFSFNGFGYNKDHMYIMDKLSDEEVLLAAEIILINLVINVAKLLIMAVLAPKVYDPVEFRDAKDFVRHALEDWYWMVVWLLVSTCCACGACMIMKHDGMDITFKFKEWNFGESNPNQNLFW